MRCSFCLAACPFLALSIPYFHENKRHQHVTFSRKSSPSVSANVRAKPTRGWWEWRPLVARLWVAKGSRRGSAASLLSLHAQNNILMKERPDRAKCPRRVALPNCGFPRPSAADCFRPSPSRVGEVRSDNSDHFPPPTINHLHCMPCRCHTLLPTLKHENCAAGGHKKGEVVWPTTISKAWFARLCSGCCVWWVWRSGGGKQLRQLSDHVVPPPKQPHHYRHLCTNTITITTTTTTPDCYQIEYIALVWKTMKTVTSERE